MNVIAMADEAAARADWYLETADDYETGGWFWRAFNRREAKRCRAAAREEKEFAASLAGHMNPILWDLLEAHDDSPTG